MINDLVRPELRNLQAYEAKEYEQVIKLDANENPYPLPLEVVSQLREQLDNLPLNRYPDPEAWQLRRQLAQYTGVAAEQIMVGNGSDELIQLLLLTFGQGGQAVITPPTFAMYRISSTITGTQPLEIPLAEDFSFPWPKILAAAQDPLTKVVFICSPNNPTGNTVDLADLENLLQNTKALVVVDEAYYEFAQKTAQGLLASYPNLIILRTFSKAFGLAALRVGYLLSSFEVMEHLKKVKMPYNLNSFSQRAARVVLANLEVFQVQIKEILKERQFLQQQLSQLPGVQVFPSEANFLLFRTKLAGQAIFQSLLVKGILVRQMGGQLTDFLRVTVGTRAENQAFLAALQDILGGK